MSDNDGYCSSAAMVLYLKNIYSKYTSHVTWNTHESKAHGIVFSELENFKRRNGEYNFDLLIVPDAGSNDIEQCKVLQEKGIDVLVLDHHLIEEENPYCVLINPQLSPNYPNKEICGTTVVYKFLQALDNELNLSYANDFIDLVAMATISDMVDTKALENRYFIKKGLSNIKNSFLLALIDKQSFSMNGKVNIHNVGFYIAPPINAVTRVGTTEERGNLFKAFIDTETQVMYKPRGKAEQLVPLYKDMARQIVNIKKRQDRLRDKIVPELFESSVDTNVINIIPIDADDSYKSLKGVLAMKVATGINRPTLIYEEELTEEGKILLKGSARNLDTYFISDLKNELDKSGLFQKVAGHSGAFGFTFEKDNLDKIIEHFNETYKNSESVLNIDFKIPSNTLNRKIIKDFNSLEDIWGHGFKEARVLITDLEVNCDEVYINDKGSLFSYKDTNEIAYKMFYPSEKVKKDLTLEGKCVTINLIGELGINEWNGEKTYQVMIKDYEVIDIKDIGKTPKKEFFF